MMKYLILLSLVICQVLSFPNPGALKKFPKKYNKHLDAVENKSKSKLIKKSSYHDYKPELKALVLHPPAAASSSELPTSLQVHYPSSYVSLYEKTIEMPSRILLPPREDSYSIYKGAAVEEFEPPSTAEKSETESYTDYRHDLGRTMGDLTPPKASSYSEVLSANQEKSKRLLKLMTEKMESRITGINPPNGAEDIDHSSTSSYSSYYTPDQSSYISY